LAGEEVSERYEYIPAQMRVIEDVCIEWSVLADVTGDVPRQFAPRDGILCKILVRFRSG
jgi:hypothetical protein